MDIPTSVLKALRMKANVPQTAIAEALGVSASVVSRLEGADTMELSMGQKYLAAIPGPDAEAARAFYKLVWQETSPTSFLHPDRKTLWRIEETLQDLARFEKAPKFDEILRKPVQSLRDRLRGCADYLQREDHNVAWVGDLGVGKTTALSFVANLTFRDTAQRQRSIFPTGSGRVTVCEVLVKAAPAFGIAVECMSPDEVRELVKELVTGLKKGETGISAELDRVLRNMSKLNRTSRTQDGKRVFEDPIGQMLDGEIDEIADRILLRMSLEQRTQSQIILSEDKEDGIRWLAENITKINNGQHPAFSVPLRISVLVPREYLRPAPYEVAVVDTKGIEGTTQRPDLRAQIDNPRTVMVLCSKFADAPGSTVLSMLKELADTGSDAVEKNRVCLLVLPRSGEAENVQDDSGGTPTAVEDGYSVREYQIKNALDVHGLKSSATIPVMFFDVARDDPQLIWDGVNRQISGLRAHVQNRAAQLEDAVRNLIANPNAARSQEARRHIAKEMQTLSETWQRISPTVRPAHQNLVEQITRAHQSSVAASMNRRGAWANFDVHHILGVGVQADANARTQHLFSNIDARLAELTTEFKQLSDIREFLTSLREDLKERRQLYLKNASDVGRTAFTPYLEDASSLWRTCRQRWGAGGGYREDIAGILREWFEESPELEGGRRRIESALKQSWREMILKPLLEVTQVELEHEES